MTAGSSPESTPDEPMQPKIPPEFLLPLRESGQAPPWRCRLHLRRGRTLFAVEIAARGEIVGIDRRPIYSPADLGFSVSIIEGVTLESP